MSGKEQTLSDNDKNRDEFWKELFDDSETDSQPTQEPSQNIFHLDKNGHLINPQQNQQLSQSYPQPAQNQPVSQSYQNPSQSGTNQPQRFEPTQPPEEKQEPTPPEVDLTRDTPIARGYTKRELRREERKKKKLENFEVDYDFDSEYQDVDEKIIKRGTTKRTGCLGGILMFLMIISISLILACLGWMAATDVLGLGNEEGVVEITLPRDVFYDKEVEEENEDGTKTVSIVSAANIDDVAEILKNEGLIKYEWLFKLYSRFSNADIKVKPGTYQLNLNYDYRAIVNGMTSSGGTLVEVRVTIPEGYTTLDIVNILVENGVCGEEELLDALANYEFDYDFLDGLETGDPRRLEGYLFPDTYDFYVGDTPSRVIGKFLTNFETKWTEEMSEKAANLGYSMYDVLKVASMIEKEAGADSERDTIASVIYNRLENPDKQGTNGMLQIDATIYYAIEGTDEAFSTGIDSPYNTYMYAGLTPTPIANPGIASINAALEPEETDYYFYALSTDGVHRFFENYDEFVAFINSDEFSSGE